MTPRVPARPGHPRPTQTLPPDQSHPCLFIFKERHRKPDAVSPPLPAPGHSRPRRHPPLSHKPCGWVGGGEVAGAAVDSVGAAGGSRIASEKPKGCEYLQSLAGGGLGSEFWKRTAPPSPVPFYKARRGPLSCLLPTVTTGGGGGGGGGVSAKPAPQPSLCSGGWGGPGQGTCPQPVAPSLPVQSAEGERKGLLRTLPPSCWSGPRAWECTAGRTLSGGTRGMVCRVSQAARCRAQSSWYRPAPAPAMRCPDTDFVTSVFSIRRCWRSSFHEINSDCPIHRSEIRS